MLRLVVPICSLPAAASRSPLRVDRDAAAGSAAIVSNAEIFKVIENALPFQPGDLVAQRLTGSSTTPAKRSG
ncbi:MAG: hypothetical protein H6914_00955 [Novosphingobium sp.]|nr:hypothetical protein [Novosphingobium sp.]